MFTLFFLLFPFTNTLLSPINSSLERIEHEVIYRIEDTLIYGAFLSKDGEISGKEISDTIIHTLQWCSDLKGLPIIPRKCKQYLDKRYLYLSSLANKQTWLTLTKIWQISDDERFQKVWLSELKKHGLKKNQSGFWYGNFDYYFAKVKNTPFYLLIPQYNSHKTWKQKMQELFALYDSCWEYVHYRLGTDHYDMETNQEAPEPFSEEFFKVYDGRLMNPDFIDIGYCNNWAYWDSIQISKIPLQWTSYEDKMNKILQRYRLVFDYQYRMDKKYEVIRENILYFNEKGNICVKQDEDILQRFKEDLEKWGNKIEFCKKTQWFKKWYLFFGKNLNQAIENWTAKLIQTDWWMSFLWLESDPDFIYKIRNSTYLLESLVIDIKDENGKVFEK